MLVCPRNQGRHEYFTIASDKVAGVLEDIMGLAANRGRLSTGTGPKDFGLRKYGWAITISPVPWEHSF